MKHLITICFLLNFITACAQDTTKSYPNSITAKIQGFPFPLADGIFGSSINYERRFCNDHLSVGTGFIYFYRGLKGIPLELNYLFFKRKNHIETGLSYTFLFRPGRMGNLYSLNLGYRCKDFSKKGMGIKLGISPGIVEESYKGEHSLYPIFIAYFGLGYSF